jgi:flagellar hook assembly protein FlgD
MVLRPNDRVPSLDAGSHASITIYDATGAVVGRNDFAREGGVLKYVWNGRNLDGRLVSQGTYLALVQLQINGMSDKTKMKIGVKR